MEEKNVYLDLLSKASGVSVETLDSTLTTLGFFSAPASTKYHSCFEGGLCHHSLLVYSLLKKLVANVNYPATENTIAKLALLHDISKSNYYELTSINKKIYSPDGKQKDDLGNFYWSSQLGYKIKDVSERDNVGSMGFNSFLLAKSLGISFNKEEVVALCNFDKVMGSDDNISGVLGTYPLTALLHSADLLATYYEAGCDLSL